jgi:hypothetical protein
MKQSDMVKEVHQLRIDEKLSIIQITEKLGPSSTTIYHMLHAYHLHPTLLRLMDLPESHPEHLNTLNASWLGKIKDDKDLQVIVWRKAGGSIDVIKELVEKYLRQRRLYRAGLGNQTAIV